MPAVQHAPELDVVQRPHLPLKVVVALACVANFMVIIDTSIVNVALPAMRAGLGLSTIAQQWVVDGYLVTFGGFLLFCSRAGDLFGRRVVFLAGLTIFTAASLAGGLAQDSGMLLIARIVQGVGAAAVAPSSLSLITASHPEGTERGRAIALWAAAGSSAGGAGLVLGGVLTTELSWRYVLFVNVPIGLALLIAGGVSLAPSSPRSTRVRLDLPGVLTATVGVGLLAYGISEANASGWGSTRVLSSLGCAVALLLAFVVIELRSTRPLVPLAIFRHRGLSTANALMGILGVTMTSTLFFVSIYLQQVLGDSALTTGLAMVPMTGMMVAGPLAARRLVARVGVRPLLLSAVMLSAGGLAWLSRLPDHSNYLLHVLTPTLVATAGFGLMILPITMEATAGIDRRLAGLASGLLNMGRQLGGAIGLAVLVTIAATSAHDSHLTHTGAATVHGYRTAFLVAAGVSLASGLIVVLMPKPPGPTQRS